MKTIIKIVVAAFLFGCLGDMQYGYYQLVRIVAFIGFLAIAYWEYDESMKITWFLTIVSILGAIIFNPIIKISFEEETWHVLDICIGTLLMVWATIELIFLKKEKAAPTRSRI